MKEPSSFYISGFKRGKADAIRGIYPKLVSHLLRESVKEMKEYEKGYLDGYYSVMPSASS